MRETSLVSAEPNPEVQKVCDATLQMIGEVSPEWSGKLMAEKFR